MVNADAEMDTVVPIANTNVKILPKSPPFLAQGSSKSLYYFLFFTLILVAIAATVFYIFRVRGQIKRGAAQLNEDPHSIIGSNPEPEKQGRYGFQRD